MSDIAEDPAPAPSDVPATPAGNAPPAVPDPAPAAAIPAPEAPAGPAPTPSPPAAAPKTLAGGDAPDTRLQVTSTWPENWREHLAGEDRKFLERLQRFNSPADVAKSYRELESKISSGEYKAAPKPLPENATPEQVAAWRAEQGLPADADAFMKGLALPDGLVPGEADRPLLASFAEEATRAGWSQKQYNEAVSWYYKLQDHLIGEQQRADEEFHVEATRELQQEWGPEFKGNLTRITQFMDAYFPKEVQNVVLSARANDGTLIGNHPAFNKAVLELAKFVNPVGAILPNASGDGLAAADARIAEIETMMKSPIGSDAYKAYWLGEGGQRVQQEYRDLITARETLRERRGAPR